MINCSKCKGKGNYYGDCRDGTWNTINCPDCRGKGYIEERYTYRPTKKKPIYPSSRVKRSLTDIILEFIFLASFIPVTVFIVFGMLYLFFCGISSYPCW